MTDDTKMECPSSMDRTRHYFEGDDRETDEHLKGCPTCSKDMDSLRSLVDTCNLMPEGEPSEQRANDVLNAVLLNARLRDNLSRRRFRVYRIAVAAAVLVAVATGIFITLKDGTVEPEVVVTEQRIQKATVHSITGSSHTLVSAQPDEMVRLTRGTITVEVEKLAPGERFRVVIGDAEVEVRGTVFEVTAANDKLVGVRVMSGKVEVRSLDRQVVVLGPGERWERREEATPSRAGDGEDELEAHATDVEHRSKTPQVEKAGLPADRAEVAESPAEGSGVSAEEAVFNEGWDALRAGKPASAAISFGLAARGGNAAIAEDAVYWKAISHDRAGAKGAAAASMKEFLNRFPGSSRLGEVSAMLGWKLLDHGDLEGARRNFERAANDPAPRVRDSAARGLAKIDKTP